MEEDNRCTSFLFELTHEVKNFYEMPVILLTRNDYAHDIFKTMCSIQDALKEDLARDKVMDIIVEFHLNWLRSVSEIETFKTNIPDVSVEEVFESVNFTIEALSRRHKNYKKYMDRNLKYLPEETQSRLLTEIELVDEMHCEYTHTVMENLKYFRMCSDKQQFHSKISDYLDELLCWVDKINDGLALLISNYYAVHLTTLSADLNKTLQQIVDEFKDSNSPEAIKMIAQMKAKGKQLGMMVRCTVPHDLEMRKVLDKMSVLEERIKRSESENSSATMGLTHKLEYLEKRFREIEELKSTLQKFNEASNIPFSGESKDEETCSCEDFYRLRIFNHSLPLKEREVLVTELCQIWDTAVGGDQKRKSVLSILSAHNIKEEFSDEFGTFYIDHYSRKIYQLADDTTRYQLNEKNDLVPLCDDEEHVYYYDECGRYYIEFDTGNRIYKAHEKASEYMMDASGMLLKVKETRDGVTYHFDMFGRYFINEDGRKIYRETDAMSEYEEDGLGNLVRIRSHLSIFDPCPDDVNVSEDFKYLKKAVGPALRECIAEVLLKQPFDPIKYLSTRLIQFRERMEARDVRAAETEELEVARRIRLEEERAEAERLAREAALLDQGGSEASYDSNLLHYTHADEVSVASSVK